MSLGNQIWGNSFRQAASTSVWFRKYSKWDLQLQSEAPNPGIAIVAPD